MPENGKFYDIGDGRIVENVIKADTVDKKRQDEVVQRIKDAKFTNASDFQTVQGLYMEYTATRAVV